MKLLSVLLCSIAMVRFATGNNVPLHNDLYFHHHPKVARELAKSGAQKYQRPPSVKYGPSGWSDPNEELPFSWNQPPQRYRYEDRTRRYNRAHFNYAGEAKKEDNLPYTKDGAIDWKAIKATYDEQPHYRQSYRDGENAYNRGGKYRTPYEEPDVYNMADFYNPGRNLFSKRAGGLKLAGVVPNDGYSRGVGTFYDLETHKGVCGQQYKNDQLVAATKLENKDLCGKKVEVTGPNNSTIEVTIVDGCKTCESNDLDLSPAAFEKLGEFSHATIPIRWKFV